MTTACTDALSWGCTIQLAAAGCEPLDRRHLLHHRGAWRVHDDLQLVHQRTPLLERHPRRRLQGVAVARPLLVDVEPSDRSRGHAGPTDSSVSGTEGSVSDLGKRPSRTKSAAAGVDSRAAAAAGARRPAAAQRRRPRPPAQQGERHPTKARCQWRRATLQHCDGLRTLPPSVPASRRAGAPAGKR